METKINETENMVEDVENTNEESNAATDEIINPDAEENNNNSAKTGGEAPTPSKMSDNSDLPEGVTDAPQDVEHMDLVLIKDNPALVKAYLEVSDNTSGLHGDSDLEARVKEFCTLYDSTDWEKVEKSEKEKILESLKILTSEYSSVLNISDNTMQGISTKSHIRQGQLLNIQKKVVIELGEKWEKWFKANYNPRKLRSANDYMSIAQIPNVIRYAVFGIARIKQLKKVIRITEKDPDPIYTFLSANKLVFDPECDDPIDDLIKEVDAIVAETKIKNVETENKVSYGIKDGLIRKMLLQNIPITDDMINKVHIIHTSGGDANKYLNKRYINKGKESKVVENEQKVKGFKKNVAHIHDAIEVFKGDLTKLEKVDDDQIATLEKALDELKKLKNR